MGEDLQGQDRTSYCGAYDSYFIGIFGVKGVRGKEEEEGRGVHCGGTCSGCW